MGDYKAKLPEYKSLKGISERMLAEHLKLYNGYVAKSNEIVDKLASGTVDLSKSAATYSEFRALKLEQTFNGNGMYLHQFYFENLSDNGGQAEGEVKKEIEKNFGSFEKWKDEFVATGMAGRGWAVLVLILKTENFTTFCTTRITLEALLPSFQYLFLMSSSMPIS